MDANIVQALSAFTSCDVADALIRLDVPLGGFLPGLTLWSPERQEGKTKIVGPAYTVRFERINGTTRKVPKIAGHFVDSAPAGCVILISCPKGMVNACWGGLTTMRAQQRGVSGVIIDGRARDLEELRDLGFPVFARDIGTAPPQSIAYVSEIDEPVLFEAEGYTITIRQGDLLIADINGVVCLPQEHAEGAIEIMKNVVNADQMMCEAIKKGMTFTEASKFRTAGKQ